MLENLLFIAEIPTQTPKGVDADQMVKNTAKM